MKVINKFKTGGATTADRNKINTMIEALPSKEELTPELKRQDLIGSINDYAKHNPTKVFDDDFAQQRQYLTEDTWKAIIQANPDMLDSASPKWRHIPNADIVNKYLGLAFSGEVREAINKDGVKVAGLAAAVPGAIIGGTALAQPVLSQMIYHPGTFLAETVGGTIGGYTGGAATDAVIRKVSDYDSFADMVASNSTIPELYAKMLNPGMLLGGVAGGIGGNVLYNNIIKPLAKRTITGYLASRGFNKSTNENLGRLKFHDANPLGIPLVENYLYHETPGLQFNRDGSRAWPSIAQLRIEDGKYVSARRPHGNNPDKIWWDAAGHNTGKEVYVKPKENELNVLENITEINYSPGSFSKDYYISDPVNVDKVIKYKKDPITNQYNISAPGKIVTNKTLDPSNLDYVEFNLPSNASTSLKFHERPSTLTEAERLGIPKGERKLYLTGSNADPSYYSAIGLNNTKYTQALRDYHFLQKSQQPPVTVSHHSKTPFNIFDESKFGLTDDGFNGKGFYFGETYNYGKPNEVIQKATTRGPEVRLGPHGERFYHNYGPIKRYFYLKGKIGPTTASTDFFSLKNHIIGVTDGTAKEYIVGHPELIKLADHVTFDDLGLIIPLSKRDNFSNPDIRYKQGGQINYLNLFK